jgi:hypothetical protein
VRRQSITKSNYPLVFLFLAASLSFLTARAEETAQRHVRPVGVIEQLEHCRVLVENEEDSATLESCFDHAELILNEGLALRKTVPPQSEEFEDQLDSGVREIVARLEALSLDDRERLRRQLLGLDETISSLRADLSRTAAAEHLQLSLISRGGISLGNWQAGFLYSVTEWAKSRPGQRGAPGGRV